jgi:hypothetical protein
MSNLIYTQPIERAEDTAIAASANGGETDSSGWERWLRGHLDIERQVIVESIVEEINEVEAKRDDQIRELGLKIAECIGAVNVLRTGRAMRVRGTYSADAKYEQLDVCAVGGSSFIATEDSPGPCPGAGWQLLSSAGSRGARGSTGARGERGEPGERAKGLGFKFHLDCRTYTLSFIAPDGQIHALSLQGLFEQFVRDLGGDLPL